jgi:hypothetical protein
MVGTNDGRRGTKKKEEENEKIILQEKYFHELSPIIALWLMVSLQSYEYLMQMCRLWKQP